MMIKEVLTEEEKINLEVFETWVKCWNIPGLGAEKMVDELYAENCEVYTPLQDIYHVKMGKSKRRWRTLEISLEKLYKMRKMDVVWKIVKDNTIVLEAKTHFIMINGEERHRGFAAILTFENGKIIRDHTYMRDPNPLTSKTKTQ